MYDPDDKTKAIAQSKTAARKAVLQTAASRFILALPLMGPALILFLLEKLRLMPSNFWLVTLIQMSLFFCQLYVGMPLGISTFPPNGTIRADELKNDDPEVQNKILEYKNDKGMAVKYL